MFLVHLATSEDVSDAGMTLAEVTFRRLLRLITSGEVPPGADVTEEKLAVDLQVSRTPLRDAIRRLESLGILARRTNRTLIVPPLSLEEMEDLSLSREALEVLVVRRVAQRVRAGEADVSRLKGMHERVKSLALLRDGRFSLEAGMAFHRELYRLANVPTAIGLLDQVVVRLERYRRLVEGDPERGQGVAREHEAIMAAILSGDEIAAERAMRDHLLAGRQVYVDILRRRGA